jgi:hypothetical protein
MTRRYRRRRGRPNAVDAIVSAVVIGAVLYGAILAFTAISTNAVGVLAGFVTGVVFRHILKVPTVRVMWRRQ